MQEKRNEQTTGTKTIKKIGKTTYEVIVHFNDKSSETMQDKLKRIMLREFRRKSDEKKMILIKKSLTSSNRKDRKIHPYFLRCQARPLRHPRTAEPHHVR